MVAWLDKYRAARVHLTVRTGGSDDKTLEMMELFAREAMPHVRDGAHVDETAGVGR